MCGIAGLFSNNPLSSSWVNNLKKMCDLQIHRGPDDYGYFWEGLNSKVPVQDLPSLTTDTKIAFGHRRLSIIDLSVAARQPLVRGITETNSEENVFLTYNGEIYNFKELRHELRAQGHEFETESDTEVLLEAYRAWGIDAVSRFRGIFAFAIADMKNKKVFLARDHLGVKPLYFTKIGETWAFASEMKAFLGIKEFNPEIDYEALRKYLKFLWIPGNHTGLKGVSKLTPGTFIEINLITKDIIEKSYWNPFDVLKNADPILKRGQINKNTIDEIEAEFSRAVSEEMISDVPLGAFLSGGLDSSMICTLMKKNRNCSTSRIKEVETFSVGYSAKDLAYDIVIDDLPYAKKVSKFLGTKNKEILLSPKVENLLPKVIWHLDEPLGDPAAISSYLICSAAKDKLTVLLSGMGGDELFAGYPRQKALIYGKYYRHFPRAGREVFENFVNMFPGSGRGLKAKFGRASKKFLKDIELGAWDHYVSMETYFPDSFQENEVFNPDGPFSGVKNPATLEYLSLRDKIETSFPKDHLAQVLCLDLLTYLPNLNCAYTDKTSMANSVEVRVPFLDHKLVELAIKNWGKGWMRFRGGQLEGKYPLKLLAEKYLPKDIVWRKKAGFGSPVRSWLRQDLSELRSELLSSLEKRKWFRPDAIKKIETDFLAGKEDHALRLWMLISLELWTKQFIDAKGSISIN